MNRKAIEQALIERAWADESFKQELMENPKRVLEAEVAREVPGFRFPEAMQITIMEESSEQIVIVLPVNPASQTGALKHEDLARVSGGAGDPCDQATPVTVIPPIAPKGMGGFGITVGPSPAVW